MASEFLAWCRIFVCICMVGFSQHSPKHCEIIERRRYFGHHFEVWIGNDPSGYFPKVAGHDPIVVIGIDTDFIEECRKHCEQSLSCFSWTFWLARHDIGGHCFEFPRVAKSAMDDDFFGGACVGLQLDWFALAPGVYATDQGVPFEVGFANSLTGIFDITFSPHLAGSCRNNVGRVLAQPRETQLNERQCNIVIIPTVQYSTSPFTIPRLDPESITQTGFSATIQAIGHDLVSAKSVLGYLAIPASSGTIGGVGYDALFTPAEIIHNWTKYDFPKRRSPRVFAGVTGNGKDPVAVVVSGLKRTSVKIRLKEPSECGFDDMHKTPERVSLLVFDGADYILNSSTLHLEMGTSIEADFIIPFPSIPAIFLGVIPDETGRDGLVGAQVVKIAKELHF